MAYQETIQIANIDREKIDPATQQGIEALGYLLQLLKPLSIISSGTGRLSIDIANLATGTLSSISSINSLNTVNTVSTVTNTANIGGLGGYEMQYNMAHSAYASSIFRNLTF